MNEKGKFKPYVQNQPMLLPHDIRDLIDPSSPVWLINEYAESLDLSEIEARYSHLGQNAYNPKMLIKDTQRE